MNSINDTIVALCSGAVKSAIAVIRVSGNDSFLIVDSIFSNKKEKEHQKAYYGFIKENDEIIDEVLQKIWLKFHVMETCMLLKKY